jgi:hypothetical protein
VNLADIIDKGAGVRVYLYQVRCLAEIAKSRAPQIAALIEIDAGNATTGYRDPDGCRKTRIRRIKRDDFTLSGRRAKAFRAVHRDLCGVDRPLAATPKTIAIVSATARIVSFDRMRLVGGMDTFLRS